MVSILNHLSSKATMSVTAVSICLSFLQSTSILKYFLFVTLHKSILVSICFSASHYLSGYVSFLRRFGAGTQTLLTRSGLGFDPLQDNKCQASTMRNLSRYGFVAVILIQKVNSMWGLHVPLNWATDISVLSADKWN